MEFNKWEIYKILKKNKKIDIFLPETALLKCSDDAFDMMNRYKSIFIKPCIGSQGIGIIHATKISRNKFNIYYYSNNKVCFMTISYIEMDTLILKQIRNCCCIVQRSIKLVKYNGCPVDFRLSLCKRLQDNCWQCNRILGLIATNEQTITSLKYGGKIIEYDKIKFNTDIQNSKSKQEMLSISNKIAGIIESHFQDNIIVQFGLDFAIDYTGGVWFIDANPYAIYQCNFK